MHRLVWPKGPVGERAIRLYRDLATLLDADEAAAVVAWATDPDNGCVDGYAELMLVEALTFGYADHISVVRGLADRIDDVRVAEALRALVARVEATHPRAKRRRHDRGRRQNRQTAAVAS